MTSPHKMLEEAGIHCYPDSVDVDHIRYSGQARRRAARFHTAQAALLTAASAPGVLAGRLVCLELIRPSELDKALRASPYSLRGKTCIEWNSADQRIDRRALCAFTALECSKFATVSDQEIAALEDLLGSELGYQSVPPASRLIELERDLACWAAQRLPKPLWAHVSGLRPMTPLPRHSAALADATGVPINTLDEIAISRRVEASDMLDTAVSSARKADTPWIVKLAVATFSVRESETSPETLDRWGRELIALRAQVEDGDVASAVVVAWQFDLVESGTLTKVDAPPSTRARYARVASLRLWQMLAALPVDVDKWSPAEMNAGYLALMSDPSCKDKAGLGAAISAFQGFAHEVFGIPPSSLGLHKLIPQPRPRAQWIPKSALDRAIRWIDEDTAGDPLLKEITALMLLLAYSAPLRLSELRWIRLANISMTLDGVAEIEITAWPGRSRLKTPAATRRVLVYDPATLARLNAFIQRREDEGAPSNSLLFATSNDDMSPYRPHAVHVTLLRLLKQATGDPSMTFHGLRHTVISNVMEQLLSSSSITNGNRLIQLTDWVGHEVAVTTLKFYSHAFEFALRVQIDSNLHEHVLNNMAGERVFGIKANTLTVSARRRKSTITAFLWAIAEARAQAINALLPLALDPSTLHEPAPISFVGALNRNFTIIHCLKALRDLQSNVDRRLIQNRLHITEAQLATIDQAAVEVTREIYAVRGRLPPSTLTGAAAVIGHLELDLPRSEQSRFSHLRSALALPQDVAVAAEAARSWLEAWRSGELCADPLERLVPLLVFLKANGTQLDSLLLMYENDGSAPEEVETLLNAAAEIAAAVFHDHLPTKPLRQARRDRARAFLVWPSSTDVGEAGRSNAGLDAYMFATAVWARLKVEDWT